jgi:hypothetical protein
MPKITTTAVAGKAAKLPKGFPAPTMERLTDSAQLEAAASIDRFTAAI